MKDGNEWFYIFCIPSLFNIFFSYENLRVKSVQSVLLVVGKNYCLLKAIVLKMVTMCAMSVLGGYFFHQSLAFLSQYIARFLELCNNRWCMLFLLYFTFAVCHFLRNNIFWGRYMCVHFTLTIFWPFFSCKVAPRRASAREKR